MVRLFPPRYRDTQRPGRGGPGQAWPPKKRLRGPSHGHWALGHGRSLTVQAGRVGPGYAIDPESSWRQWSRSARPSHCDRSESTKVLHRPGISSESDSQTQARTVSGQGVTAGSDRRRSCITVTYFNLESEPRRQLLVMRHRDSGTADTVTPSLRTKVTVTVCKGYTAS